MATSSVPLYYSSGFNNTTDPRKIAQNNRQLIAQKGDILEQQNQDQYNQGTAESNATGGYLSGIEDPLAQGQGGYNAGELSQIQYSPQDVQNIVNRAATTSGAATAAGADAAARAANAAGGNPAAVAAYRARAAQQSGVQAGDAATAAQVAAKQAQATNAENIGQTRIGQQNQGLNYYQGVQQMQNQNAQNAAQRQAGLYGTQTTGLNQSGNLGLQASQTPSTLDKIIGGVTGAAAGALSHLQDGDPGSVDSMPPTHEAIVAEGGPEAVLKMTAGPYKQFLDGGVTGSGETETPEGSAIPGDSAQSDDSWHNTPWFKQVRQNVMNKQAGSPPNSPQTGGSTWNPTTPYQQVGNVAGSLLGTALSHNFADEGEMFGDTGAIFTKPTRVMLEKDEAAVPLSYRATAKTRPSMAMPVVNQIQKKMMYQGSQRA